MGAKSMSPVHVFFKKLEIKLYPEFLSAQACTFGPKICTLSTRTCTLCSTIASDLFALTFLPHLFTMLVNLACTNMSIKND